MTDTNTVKLWAAKGLTPGERAYQVIDELTYTTGPWRVVVQEAIEAACADALADAAPKVEWVPVDRNGWNMEPVYITDGTRVAESALGYLPSWATHSAKIPPRTLPTPPQEAR